MGEKSQFVVQKLPVGVVLDTVFIHDLHMHRLFYQNCKPVSAHHVSISACEPTTFAHNLGTMSGSGDVKWKTVRRFVASPCRLGSTECDDCCLNNWTYYIQADANPSGQMSVAIYLPLNQIVTFTFLLLFFGLVFWYR